MHRSSTYPRLVLYVLMVCLLAFLVTGCFGTTEVTMYSVSGRVTEEGNPEVGVPDVTFKFGNFGVATTNSEGLWSMDGLTRPLTVIPTKDDYKFIPATRKVSSNATDVDFEARWLDYGGYVENAIWEYKITGTDRQGAEPKIYQGSRIMEVIDVHSDENNGWTDFELMTTMEWEGSDPYSYSTRIRRIGKEYYSLSGDTLTLKFTAPFNVGDIVDQGFEVKGIDGIKTSTDEYRLAFLCEKEDCSDSSLRKDRRRWFTPYVGVVKEEEEHNLQQVFLLELVSYEGQ